MSTATNFNVKRLESELHALTEVAKTLASPLGLSQLLIAVMDKITAVLDPADAGVIMLWDDSAGLFRPEAAFGYEQEFLKEIGLRAGESITGKVYDAGKACIIKDPTKVAEAMADMRQANRSAMLRALHTKDLPSSCIAAPLLTGDQKYGVLVLESITAHSTFTESDLPFVQSIADLIALAIDRAQLEARADALREARQADRMRAEVMATLSHQLRMPLSAIKGYATAMLIEDLQWSEAKRTEFLELIDEETDNMQGMITEILDSSLIDVGQMIIELQPLRLQRLAHDVALEIQHRSEKHHLIVDFSSDFPIIDADPRWIKQVFRNIIDNSIKYSPDGGLVVIRGESRSTDVVISIADQGLGISPEDLIPLFEKYFRAKPANNYHVSGTGLGLPVARAIVEAHGGRIWAESKLGQGTTLYFSLPLGKLYSDCDNE